MDSFKKLLSIAEEQALSRSLPAALRIATTIADEKWASWIKLELIGYFRDNPELKEDSGVPEYRGVVGVWYDHYGRPLVVDNPNLAFINEIRLRHGVIELEGMATSAGPLAMRAMDFSEIIRNSLKVEVSVFQIQPSLVKQILTNIKVQLLDRIAQQREKISAIPDVQIPREAEILQLKPSIYGVGIDLKALWRRTFGAMKSPLPK
jgi:hypothetical protein